MAAKRNSSTYLREMMVVVTRYRVSVTVSGHIYWLQYGYGYGYNYATVMAMFMIVTVAVAVAFALTLTLRVTLTRLQLQLQFAATVAVAATVAFTGMVMLALKNWFWLLSRLLMISGGVSRRMSAGMRVRLRSAHTVGRRYSRAGSRPLAHHSGRSWPRPGSLPKSMAHGVGCRCLESGCYPPRRRSISAWAPLGGTIVCSRPYA